MRSIETVKLNLSNQQQRDSTLPEDRKEQLAFLDQRGAIFLMTAAAAKCLEIIVERSLPNKFRVSFPATVSPPTAIQLWSPIIGTIIPFAPQLRPAVETSLNLESARRVIETFTQLVRATSTGNAETYRTFARQLLVQ